MKRNIHLQYVDVIRFDAQNSSSLSHSFSGKQGLIGLVIVTLKSAQAKSVLIMKIICVLE